jgi:NADPH:quinone reductase-like Zn-dependent oxidoreductase
LLAEERVLVHGAAGGVGSFAVQLARWWGARVVATASSRHAGLVREFGAEEVIDYRAARFDEIIHGRDLVVDTVGGDTWERSWRVLRPGGRLVSIAVPPPPERAPVNDVRAVWFVVVPDRAQLGAIGRLIDAGHVRPIVDEVLPLARGREAYGPSRNGRGPGKLVLRVAG